MSYRTWLIASVGLWVVSIMSHELPAELVAHWKLNEGSGSVFQDSAGDNDGFLIGGSSGPQFVNDVPPTTFDNPFALSFDAAQQQYVQTTYEGIEDDAPRTISAWVKTESTAGQAIVAYGSRNVDGEKWHFRINPDGAPRVPGAIRTESQGGNQTGDTNVADGQWHHVVSVFDGTDNLDVQHYVDGALEGETGTTDEPIFTTVGDILVSIGARQQTPPAFENFMDGLIDDVRMYDRALTEIEIQNLGSTPTQDGLVAHWNFDDGPGSQMASESVSGNDGELLSIAASSTIEWISEGPPVQETAVEFSGDNSWIQTEFEGIGGNDPRTVTFWMRTEADNTHGIVAWGNDVDTEKWHIRINNNAGNGELGAIRTEVQGGQNVASTPINDGEWHHVAVIFPDGGEFNSDVIHVVDGEIDEQSGGGDQTVNTLIGPGAEPVTLGMRVQGANRQFFPGALADVRIYDEELDLETIRAIMAGEGLGGIKGDFNNDGMLDALDLDAMTVGMAANDLAFDLNGDNQTNIDDRLIWVRDLKGTWFGDANLNGEFNTSDLVDVFQKGKFETGQSATWSQGDWDGDGFFATGDFVLAFQDGGFEKGPRDVAIADVPEPSSLGLLMISAVLFFLRRK